MMEEQRKKDGLKIAIIVLAILLGISSAVLAGTILYKHLMSSKPVSLIVPDNIITPNTEKEKQTQSSDDIDEETLETTQNQPLSVMESTNTNVNTKEKRMATAIFLHNRNAGDNMAFHAGNLFPGDAETKYFCVRVSYKDTVTVKYHADIRPGYEKLAEVIKCRIVLPATDKIMYDGLMKDMPESLDHVLYTASETTTDLYYEINAYLDTSVGNAYQNRELIADFRWWVEEESHLIDVPKTGDETNIFLWTGLLGMSLFMLMLLWVKRKKEAQNEQE